MNTIGHHTCKQEGGEERVLKEAPFISIFELPTEEEEENPEILSRKNSPFLGTGYYYWDNNEGIAKWWGDMHYKEGFYIVKSDLLIDNGTFLDLIGDRSSMIWLQDMIKTLHELGYDKRQWYLGKLIETLKEIKQKTGEYSIFPYESIRAIDYRFKKKSNYLVNFAPGKPNFTILDPRMIICLLKKDSTIIKTVTIIYDSTQ